MHFLVEIAGKQIRIRGNLLRLASLEADKYEFIDNPEEMIAGLKKSGIRIDLFTFMQRLPEQAPKFKYPMELDNLAVLPVSTFDEWWMKQIGFKARNKAKQAEKKGVVVREVPFSEELVRGIWEVYNETPIRQGRRFPHYGKSFETVHREEATFLDNSIFAGAFFEGSLIGFTKLVHDETRTQAGLMNVVSMIKHREKAPTNALIAQGVRSCADRNISYLVYSNFSYGGKVRSSLSDFKERNAFKRFDIPRYYVPLTAFGAMAFRLGLHHKLAERIPESLASKLREARGAWYRRKYAIAAESF